MSINVVSSLARSSRMLSIEDVQRAFRRHILLRSGIINDLVNAALNELEQLGEERRTAPPPPGVERDAPELVEAIARLREHYKRYGDLSGGIPTAPLLTPERRAQLLADVVDVAREGLIAAKREADACGDRSIDGLGYWAGGYWAGVRRSESPPLTEEHFEESDDDGEALVSELEADTDLAELGRAAVKWFESDRENPLNQGAMLDAASRYAASFTVERADVDAVVDAYVARGDGRRSEPDQHKTSGGGSTCDTRVGSAMKDVVAGVPHTPASLADREPEESAFSTPNSSEEPVPPGMCKMMPDVPCGCVPKEPGHWCAHSLARAKEQREATEDGSADSLRSCREQLDVAREQITRLMGTLAVFADHGHPADWRDRPVDEEVHVIVGHPMDHVLFVRDLLRAHAVYHDVRKELDGTQWRPAQTVAESLVEHDALRATAERVRAETIEECERICQRHVKRGQSAFCSSRTYEAGYEEAAKRCLAEVQGLASQRNKEGAGQ